MLKPVNHVLIGTAVLACASSLAWGPATHITHIVHLTPESMPAPERTALTADTLVPLKQAPEAFLLGSILPDVRELTRKGHPLRRHTHRYASVFCLLERATSIREKAFALGSIAHLAQDTSAQLFYVPRKMCSGRIGMFHIAGLSQEDFIEAMVEVHHGAFGLLRDTARGADEQLIAFYANTLADVAGQPDMVDETQRLALRFCRLAAQGSWVGRPLGYAANLIAFPLAAPLSKLANPWFYRDAPQYFELGNVIFLDLATRREQSEWCRNWPIWSRNVQLFAGTQGDPFLKLSRCTNGVVVYDCRFQDASGKKLSQCVQGQRNLTFDIELSCTQDVETTVALGLFFRPEDQRRPVRLAEVTRQLQFRLHDPKHRQHVSIKFAAPRQPGTVYFTADLQAGFFDRPELCSLKPGCSQASKAGWPPVLVVGSVP